MTIPWFGQVVVPANVQELSDEKELLVLANANSTRQKELASQSNDVTV